MNSKYYLINVYGGKFDFHRFWCQNCEKVCLKMDILPQNAYFNLYYPWFCTLKTAMMSLEHLNLSVKQCQ